jgi:hypothetical protein
MLVALQPQFPAYIKLECESSATCVVVARSVQNITVNFDRLQLQVLFCSIEGFLKIKQVAKEAFTLFLFIIMFVGVIIPPRIITSLNLWGLFTYRPVNYFIKFTSVKPYAPAVRAIVDFNPLSFRHDKPGIFANGTIHNFFLLGVSEIAIKPCL